MTIHYYDDKSLLTLYAYLRQTELSIARGLSDKWENARSYLQDHYLANELIEILNSNISVHKNKYTSSLKLTYLKLRNKQFLNYQEIIRLCFLLNVFKEIFYDNPPKKYTLGLLRLELAKSADLIRKRINCKKRKLLADNIEHYNQHYNGKFYTIEQIVNGL